MSRKILLVDDDPDFRTAVKTILQKAGYECFEASSAHQGLRSVLEKKPDMILLDVMMEDISSGFRFVKKRREIENQNEEPHIPILIMTSIQTLTDLDFKERIQLILHSADDFLGKPVDSEKLLRKIENMVCSCC